MKKILFLSMILLSIQAHAAWHIEINKNYINKNNEEKIFNIADIEINDGKCWTGVSRHPSEDKDAKNLQTQQVCIVTKERFMGLSGDIFPTNIPIDIKDKAEFLQKNSFFIKTSKGNIIEFTSDQLSIKAYKK